VTLRTIDGFEMGVRDADQTGIGAGTFSGANPHTGSYCWLPDYTATSYYIVQSGQLDTTIYFTLWAYVDALPASNEVALFALVNGANFVQVALTTSGTLKLYDGGTEVGESSGTVTVDGHNRIDLTFVANSSGSYALKLKGTTELSGTRDFSGSSYGDAYVGCYNPGGSSTSTDASAVVSFDDAWFSNSAFPPDLSLGCEVLIPTGNGNYTAWTGTYADVDEPSTNDGDTSYVVTGSTNKESFSLGNVAGACDVKAIQLSTVSKQVTAGAGRGFLRISGTDYNGDSIASVSDYYHAWTVWETSPATSSPWTDGEVDGMEAGVECTSAGDLRVTQLVVYAWTVEITAATGAITLPFVVVAGTGVRHPSASGALTLPFVLVTGIGVHMIHPKRPPAGAARVSRMVSSARARPNRPGS